MGDFWRMIWEYKIKAVVMLTQCVLMSRVSHNLMYTEDVTIIPVILCRKGVTGTGLSHDMAV